MTPARHIHALAGAPALPECSAIDGRCWLCGYELERGMLAAKWQGANFTDQNKARAPSSSLVCEPCVWACSWVQPPGFPDSAPGKKGLNLRLFSHLWDERGYLALNKASKPAIRQWLREPKRGAWFAAIADSGQKHMLPWTPLNPAGSTRGVVRFEERDVALPSERYWGVVDAMTALLTAGVTKDEIDRCEYSARSWARAGIAVDEFERVWAFQRGGGWWALALWLSQREEQDADGDAARGAEAADSDVRDGGAGTVSRGGSQPTEALGAAHEPHAERGADQRGRRGVGDGAPAGARDRERKQGDLFDDA